MYGCKRSCQSGVLHTDLNGDCTAFALIQFQNFSYAIANRVTKYIMKNDYTDDQKAGSHDLCGVCGYNSCYNRYNRSGGDQRKDFYYCLGKFRKEMVDDKSKQDRYNHDFNDGYEHAHYIHIYRLSCIQLGQQWSQERSKNR